MLYTAAVTKKTRLFQRAYTIDGSMIYITDTKRAKKRFLKSGIKNVVFNTDLSEDEVFGNLVKAAEGYSEAFLLNYAEEMLLQLSSFLKIQLPVDLMAISDERMLHIAVRYAKTVILPYEGEDCVIDGVNVIYKKRLHRLPDMAIVSDKGFLPPLCNVPTVDIRKKAKSSKSCITMETLCFDCDLLPYEISAKSLMYLLEGNGDFDYRITCYRKKLPSLFTFS